MITILIADDNAVFNLSLSSFLTKEKDIKIVDMCLDGKTALVSYLKNKPDILILDLDMPSLNGLQILDYLNEFDEGKQMNNIIVVSGNTKLLRKLSLLSKVYCVLNKPCEFSEILAKIQEIKKYSTYMDALKLSIFNYMQKFNFNMNSIGTIYLSEMILLNYTTNNSSSLKTLIHKVALKNNTNYSTVKSAIYHAVDSMNRFVNIENLEKNDSKYFKSKKITANDVITFSKKELL